MTWTEIPTPPGRLFEAPRWIPGAQAFQWVDILAATIHRWNPGKGGASEDRATGLEFATVALPLDEDRSLVASRDSLHVYSWSERTLMQVGSWRFADDIRFNDGAIAPTGEIYLGTMSMARARGRAALYRFDLGAAVLDVVAGDVGISNGLSWDSDTTGYYIDSLVPQVERITMVDGNLLRRPWVALGVDDEPDGLTIAADGTIVVALWGGSRVLLIDPESGSQTGVPIPDLFPTSVAFGGAEDELVVVTTAAEDGASAGRPGRVLVASSRQLLDTRTPR